MFHTEYKGLATLEEGNISGTSFSTGVVQKNWTFPYTHLEVLISAGQQSWGSELR